MKSINEFVCNDIGEYQLLLLLTSFISLINTHTHLACYISIIDINYQYVF